MYRAAARMSSTTAVREMGVPFDCSTVANPDENGSDADDLGGGEIETGVADDP